MIVEQIYTDVPLRNFNYLLADEKTKEALAVDPLIPFLCLERAREKGYRITWVFNTHEHLDHTAGNEEVLAATGARLAAHEAASIEGVSLPLKGGEEICIGESLIKALYTPGHTLAHLCLLGQDSEGRPFLVSGDTLFNAGCGNCIHGGDPDKLYETFVSVLEKLEDDTLIYPGHDYLENNLRFSLSREPDNQETQALLEKAKNQDPRHPLITTLAMEKKINPFFRLRSFSIIQKLKEDVPGFPEHPSEREVFLALRELRNRW